MSIPSVLESDPLAMLGEVCKKLEIDTPENLDLSLLDKFSFKSNNPGKWPSWRDLDIHSRKQGSLSSREVAIKAVHDLCSALDLTLDHTDSKTRLGGKEIERHRAEVVAIRKKLVLLEDALSPVNSGPLLTALVEASKRLARLDSINPEIGILDAFVFRSGKPGLFTTWADLDMMSGKAGATTNRGSVILALRDLISKNDQMLARPVCQRALGSVEVEKFQSMSSAISEKLTLLEEALSPPTPQPLLSALEEVSRRFEEVSPEAFAIGILDSFAFCPGKPGLFIAWTDLDITSRRTGSLNNKGAVIMAVDDLIAKFDQMLSRPACQKALGTATIEKYRSMRNSVGEKLDQIKRAIVPSHSNVSQRSSSSATTVAPLTITPPSQLLLHEPKHSREQERIDAVKRRIGDKTPIVCPKLFSRAAYMEAGALAGTLMIAGMLISMIFRSFIQTIPLIGILAIVLTFVRRQGLVATTAKRCAIAKNLYKKATENKDILSIFPLLTRHAQAQFLVGLDSEFRKATAKRHAGLKNMCAHIDTALSNCPDSFERTKALINLSKKGLGEEVVHALAEKDIDQLCQE